MPQWAEDIQQRHSYSRFGAVAVADFLPRPLCFWARFIVLLGFSSCIAAMEPRHKEGTFASVNRSATLLEGQMLSDSHFHASEKDSRIGRNQAFREW